VNFYTIIVNVNCVFVYVINMLILFIFSVHGDGESDVYLEQSNRSAKISASERYDVCYSCSMLYGYIVKNVSKCTKMFVHISETDCQLCLK